MTKSKIANLKILNKSELKINNSRLRLINVNFI